jgi:hypothetical protein
VKTFQKIVSVTLSMFAVTIGGANVAQAHAFGAGLWELIGYETGYELCLETNGTWYSPNVSHWAGYWSVMNAPGEKGTLVGSFAPGFENDSFVVAGSKVHWNEWYSDYSTVAYVSVSWRYEGASCGEPAKDPVNTKNPIERMK